MVFLQKLCKIGVKFGFIQIFYVKNGKIEDFNEIGNLFCRTSCLFLSNSMTEKYPFVQKLWFVHEFLNRRVFLNTCGYGE